MVMLVTAETGCGFGLAEVSSIAGLDSSSLGCRAVGSRGPQISVCYGFRRNGLGLTVRGGSCVSLQRAGIHGVQVGLDSFQVCLSRVLCLHGLVHSFALVSPALVYRKSRY